LVPTPYTVEAYSRPVHWDEAHLNPKGVALALLDLNVIEDEGPEVVVESLGQISTVLLVSEVTPLQTINRVLPYLDVSALLSTPLGEEEGQVLREVLERYAWRPQRSGLEVRLAESNRQLNQRLQELNVIYTVGKSVAASLDLDEVLHRVVNASINLTQAEEGFILLREDERLFLRIAQNMEEELAQRFNVEASDEIAWRVIRSGRPVMLKRETKIATGFLVRSLLYVPLHAPGRGTIGVLGVVNRKRKANFTEAHLFTLSAITDFAGIAIENARLFTGMEAEQERIHALLTYATEVILVTDLQNRLLLWSQQAAEAFSIPSDAEGERIDETVQHPEVQEMFTKAEREGENVHAEISTDEDRVFNAQLTTTPHFGRVLMMQEITHLKELDRLKTEFVSTVSHDLRTPLTAIQGYVELLDRAGPLNDMQQRFIDKALGSLAHITALISDLLDIGQIEAGYDLEMRPVKLDNLVAETAQEMEMHVERAGLTLRWQCEEGPLWVMGNAHRLRQVLDNLIDNAIKYHRPPGWIEMVAHQDNGHVVVSVRDNGIGIPIEDQPHIFDRFYRVHTEETEDIPGTGLGLAIVKSVIEKHKGRIWVESARGKGTEFSFILPPYGKRVDGRQ
jgi:two-component system NtrC family sensor kinase